MESRTKWHITMILGSIVFLAILTIIFISTNKSQVEFPLRSEHELEECQTYVYNSASAVDVVFLSDQENTERYVDFFYNTEPFSNFKESFNFYFISDYKPECKVYKGIAILCDSRKNIQKSASCPNDFIIVLVDDVERNLRSSAYVNVVSINTKHQLTVLTHELGHIFANLAEEYVPAELPKGQKNCVTSCEKFGGLQEKCYDGCSKVNYMRSIENGVMRTLRSNDFGDFNEKIMTEFIQESMVEKGAKNVKLDSTPSRSTGLAINELRDCSAEKYYEVILNTKDKKITRITEKTGCAPSSIGKGPDSYKVFSNEEVISEKDFNLNLYTTNFQSDEQETISGEVIAPENQDHPPEIIIAIPTAENSEEIVIYQEDVPLASFPLNHIGAQPCEI
jgi:hypothetical protein